MAKNKIIAIVAIVIVIIVIGSVIAYEYPRIAPKPAQKYELAVYPGPSGPVNADHILGGCVLAIADTAHLSSAKMAAEEQFMAYMLSPPVQYDCMKATGFIPISSSDISNYHVPDIYSRSNATVTIDYYTSISITDYKAFTQKAISNFESLYPNIIIKPTDIAATSIVSTVEADVKAASTTPIVMSIDNLDVGILAYGGYLVNLKNVVSEVTPSNVITSIVKLTNDEANIFGGSVPFITQIINTPLVWINYSALKSAGITSMPATYKQMLQDAKILYKKYGRGMVNMQGHGGASTATELYQILVQFGGNPVVFNNTGDIQGMYCLYNLSKYFSPEYKTSYWATYKGLASNKYAVMDYQWPGSVNLTALGMKYNATGSHSIVNISLQALSEGVFIRDPVSWISEWQVIMDSAFVKIIESGTPQNYTTIAHVLSDANAQMYSYLQSHYNNTVAKEYENGYFKPIVV
ncbi:ABC transporter substrate-binding protein [Picrophilus oshimae]|uniref:Sugar ABC transporter 1, extracellular binding protein n=1 Tax=Picrophilus torridus (strain ATCC 700027 / DSM 9790 / JCM 10055 / NBRC 100828 / KAW 2/3) TaxID=1122961 RepID=Q6L081_PICTO|nr:ABC transporter substrate-binding protein [Picrophilus oshimae]AAT43621.1 sugar ABC transporter 1, extracellular binding protein [Picrophilus oshimae DSM 9789]